jgi:hypothetical protein
LAVCDGRTVNRSDLIEVEFIDDGFIRRNFMAKYSENYRFYYLHQMTKEEVVVFKVFDSASVKAKRKF